MAIRKDLGPKKVSQEKMLLQRTVFLIAVVVKFNSSFNLATCKKLILMLVPTSKIQNRNNKQCCMSTVSKLSN